MLAGLGMLAGWACSLARLGYETAAALRFSPCMSAATWSLRFRLEGVGGSAATVELPATVTAGALVAAAASSLHLPAGTSLVLLAGFPPKALLSTGEYDAGASAASLGSA